MIPPSVQQIAPFVVVPPHAPGDSTRRPQFGAPHGFPLPATQTGPLFNQQSLNIFFQLKKREWSDLDVARALGCKNKDRVFSTVWQFVLAGTTQQQGILQEALRKDKTSHKPCGGGIKSLSRCSERIEQLVRKWQQVHGGGNLSNQNRLDIEVLCCGVGELWIIQTQPLPPVTFPPFPPPDPDPHRSTLRLCRVLMDAANVIIDLARSCEGALRVMRRLETIVLHLSNTSGDIPRRYIDGGALVPVPPQPCPSCWGPIIDSQSHAAHVISLLFEFILVKTCAQCNNFRNTPFTPPFDIAGVPQYKHDDHPPFLMQGNGGDGDSEGDDDGGNEGAAQSAPTEKPKQQCARCHKWYTVKKSGLLRKHKCIAVDSDDDGEGDGDATQFSPTGKPKKRCPRCQKWYTINNDGSMRKHECC